MAMNIDIEIPQHSGKRRRESEINFELSPEIERCNIYPTAWTISFKVFRVKKRQDFPAQNSRPFCEGKGNGLRKGTNV
jgi:hypothetical protein